MRKVKCGSGCRRERERSSVLHLRVVVIVVRRVRVVILTNAVWGHWAMMRDMRK